MNKRHNRNVERVTEVKAEQLEEKRDAFRLALIELERLAYFFGPGADEHFNCQIRECRRLRDELFWLETSASR